MTATDVNPDIRVRLLKALAECSDPKDRLDKIADRFDMTPVQVRAAVLNYGWPRPEAMARAAVTLEKNSAGVRRTPVVPAGTVTVTTAGPATTAASQLLRVADLIPHPSNPDGRADDVDELAASIASVGMLQPLVVTAHPNRKGWLILAGHRQAAALRKLGRTHAACIIRDAAGRDLDDQLFVMLIENVQRKDLSAMEKAYAFGDLRDRRKMSINKIAERSGLAVGTISYYLSLLELDAETQAKVQLGEVQVTQAINAVKQVRAARRRTSGEKQPGHPVQLEPAWFTLRHPLARRVTEACSHTSRPKVGHAGCGQCWEDAIRADERTTDAAVGA
jgi:ParB family chromosome partitioning protein